MCVWVPSRSHLVQRQFVKDIFPPQLSVSVLISTVFRTTVVFIFAYRYYVDLSVLDSFLSPVAFKSLVQVSTSNMACSKLYCNTTVLIICMQN